MQSVCRRSSCVANRRSKSPGFSTFQTGILVATLTFAR